ncbi:SDR family oxidoreductase [Streptomyces sp. GbtcB6]|uniref:SDR family oxidoreductase n=1 Tax=Streptomyces sp. GbtcB6 TaxID=2824751 RepID=UPI001C2FD5B3|nr:NAD(P)H-binding protein [Streptomyces sp. GbtcB6]
MKVVVIDDGGSTGVETVARVNAHGNDANLVSASSGVNLLTGEGLSEALEDCSVVVDLSGPPSLDDGVLTEDFGLVIDEEAVLQTLCRSTTNLASAAAAAGVEHYVALSVVGVDRLSKGGCFRALYAKEALIRQSRMPYSIIRATQLFESAGDIADAATEDWIIWVAPVQIRPVSCAEVAALVAHTASSRPLLGVREIAGPDQFRLDAFVRASLTGSGEYRRVFPDDRSPYFGAGLRRHDLLPGADAYTAPTHYGDWLDSRLTPGSRKQHNWPSHSLAGGHHGRE